MAGESAHGKSQKWIIVQSIQEITMATTQNRNFLVGILLLLLLLQSSNMLYSFIQVSPAFAKLGPVMKVAIFAMPVAVIYYFAALAFFFLQETNPETTPGQLLIAGRAFRPNWSPTNPTNHVVLATLLLFIVFTTIWANFPA